MDRLKLNPTQLNIVTYLYRFRFITTNQLQKLLGHKYIRSTNYHLKSLTTNGIVGRHHSRKLGFGNLPAVYYLKPGSIRILKDLPDTNGTAIKRIYKEKTRSQRFIEYSHFLVEYYLYLRNSTNKKGTNLHFYTKTDLMNHHYMIRPLPDTFFSIVDKKSNTSRFFVEAINSGSPRFAIRNRINQYSDYFEEEVFEKATGYPLPTLLIICPDTAIKIYLIKHLERVYEETSLDQTQVYVSTRGDVFSEKWNIVTSEDV